MSSSGYLVPPSKDPSQENLWIETWKRIDRFLPDLRKDLSLEGEEGEVEGEVGEVVVAPEKPIAESQPVAEEQAPVQTGPEEDLTEKATDEE